MKYINTLLFLFYISIAINVLEAQVKREREFRILQSQFPENALQYIKDTLKNARRIRFYKEIDSNKISYEAKFKKDKLKYSIEFDQDGVLEDVEILIKKVDIPRNSFVKIENYLKDTFVKYRMLRMQRQYPVGEEGVEKTIENAFQNSMLPTIKYELIVGGKKNRKYNKYELLFDANGNFEHIRISLPPNYDHVLY